MAIDPTLTRQLEASARAFAECVSAVPQAAFLTQYTEWSPRDVVAHLIGWNDYTLRGCQQIQAGQLPFYFEDIPHDFSHVNAASVAKYASPDNVQLLASLDETLRALLAFLADLEQEAWDKDFGAPTWNGHLVTISTQVIPLIEDYTGHMQEIQHWTQQG